MAFNSLSYFLFLPCCYLVFSILPQRARSGFLLAASYGFYACLGSAVLPAGLALVTVVTFYCAKAMEGSATASARRGWFWGGTAASVALLGVLKYLPPVLQANGLSISGLAAGIGVSYFCFQSISYLADVYLELEEAEQSLGRYALYLAFFPKLLQGPIERGGDLLPQLAKPYVFSYQLTRSGLILFAWGLFKKCVLADRLSLYADAVFGDPASFGRSSLMIGVYCYALQIYFDFAGYTDMARGAGRLFGIELSENFRSPYLAGSVAEFWRRWHMTFSRWLLDYLFKPLQMAWRDLGQNGTALALLITFLISGVWHGASWGFLIWGGLHGLYLACSTYYRPYQKKLYRALGIEKAPWVKVWQGLITFHLICLAWVFFRAASVGDAVTVLRGLLIGGVGQPHSLFATLPAKPLALTVAIAGIVIFIESGGQRDRYLPVWERYAPLRWAGYYLLLGGLLLFGAAGGSQFIYFKF